MAKKQKSRKTRKARKKCKGKYHKEWLTEAEWERLQEQPMTLKQWVIVQMLYRCALRVSELCNMKVRDIDLEDETVTIKASKHQHEPRPIPIASTVLLKALGEYVEDNKLRANSYLISGGKKGRPMTRQAIYKFVKRLAKSAEIDKEIGTHTFRRTRATHLLNKGVDVAKVSKFLRHTKLATTMVYLDIAVDSLRESIRDIDE